MASHMKASMLPRPTHDFAEVWHRIHRTVLWMASLTMCQANANYVCTYRAPTSLREHHFSSRAFLELARSRKVLEEKWYSRKLVGFAQHELTAPPVHMH